MYSSYIQKKISFSLLDTSKETSHCFGINSLAWDDNNSLLYTAGRDTTIRVWDTSSSDTTVNHKKCFEHHADWVNDISLFDNGSKLLSCSSDCSVIVTDTLKDHSNSTHIINHSDYVKKVSNASLDVNSVNVYVISGGLEGNVYLHVIDNSMNVKLLERYETKHSIYSLAIRKPSLTNQSMLIASAGSDQTIKIFDPRSESNKPLSKLKGHTDNIKSLTFSHDGNKLISGSSDYSIKIWDTRMMKTLSSLFIHEDSIWSLYLSPHDDTSVFSGGRDGAVYIVNYETSHSSLVLMENFPILSMVSPNNQNDNKISLWTSTTNSEATEWIYDRNDLKDNMVTSLKSSGTLSPSSSLKLMKRTSESKEMKSTIKRHTPGRVAITEKRILNNRRYILTKDQLNNVQLWDLFNIGECKNFGNVPFDEKYDELNDIIYIPSFYSVDIKSGSLTVYLENSSCLNAVVYPQDLNFEEGSTPVNLGQKLLEALFERWIKNNNINDDSDEKEENNEDHDLKFHIPKWVWIGIEQDARCLFRIRAGDWDGSEPVPEWVIKILKNDFERKKSKILFYLHSYDEIVPSFEKKLSSESHVHLKSLSSWIINNKLSKWTVRLRDDKNSEPTQVKPFMIQFFCKDKELKPSMSFGTVKTFFWKSSDDFVIKYRVNPDYVVV